VSHTLTIHDKNPQDRLVQQAVRVFQSGGLVIYPTDSCYAIGCLSNAFDAIERLRRLRNLPPNHLLALLCPNIAAISQYALVDDRQFRLLKQVTPGAYTFILKASRHVSKRLQHDKRHTIGFRIPDNAICLALLEALQEPILSSTLILPGEAVVLDNPSLFPEWLNKQVDLVMDSGEGSQDMTTLVDLTEQEFRVLREGKGSIAALGIVNGPV